MASGQSQTFVIDTGGVTGLTAANFSVKAYVLGQAAGPGPAPGPGPATHLSVTGFQSPTSPGASHTLTVTSLDANNNVATGYRGTVRVMSSDAAATLPANYTFQASDAGVHTFSITLNTASSTQSISVVDTANGSITGSQSGIQVTTGGGGNSTATNLVYVSGNNQQASTSQSGSVSWSTPTTTGTPGATGYNNFIYDPLGGQSYLYSNPVGSASIYASDMYTYNSTSHAFTHLGGTGSMASKCTPDTDTLPGDRHPGLTLFLDSIGSRLVMVGGVNQMCNAGIAGNGSPRADQYFHYLHSTPSLDWHLATPANLPGQIDSTSAIMQDTNHNVFLKFGGASLLHNHWLYCPTYANPTPGSLTPSQTSVGCNAASTDNWVEITKSVVPELTAPTYNIPGVAGPMGTNFTGLIYAEH